MYFESHMHTVQSDGPGSLEDIKVVPMDRELSTAVMTNRTKRITCEDTSYHSQRDQAQWRVLQSLI